MVYFILELDFVKDYGAFIAAIIAPLAAVRITIWYQNREARHRAKVNLFLELVSFRDYIPLPWQYMIALNRIDVVFHNQKDICRLWHEYYDLLGQEQTKNVVGQVKEKKISLLSAMAKYLGYKNIDQIYLQRYYISQGQVDDYLADAELKKQLLRVLKSTDTLLILGNEQTQQLKQELEEEREKKAEKTNGNIPS